MVVKKNKHLKRKYGITLFQLKEMYEHQNVSCAICKTKMIFDTEALSLGKERQGESVCVDHCHTSGNVRGLLCFHCNTALGHVFDNTETLTKMITYLQQPPLVAHLEDTL